MSNSRDNGGNARSVPPGWVKIPRRNASGRQGGIWGLYEPQRDLIRFSADGESDLVDLRALKEQAQGES